jgi:hypothetical protein
MDLQQIAGLLSEVIGTMLVCYIGLFVVRMNESLSNLMGLTISLQRKER